MKGVPDTQRMAVYNQSAPQRAELSEKRKSDHLKATGVLSAAERGQWTAMLGKALG